MKKKEVIVKISPKVEKELKKLKKQNKNVVKLFFKQLKLLEKDINYPSLHLKKYYHKDNPNLWEIRINLQYRAILELFETEKSYNFLVIKVGKHDILDNF
ncbi:MAG: hypothetical protein DSY59_01660 [Persephonella sp.]|nr:MAG: hypothetical protein DSY60_03030 [Persephonella sp.]RUM61403.1 MAG: hypothetical protein DSY59_01660 [Persephonella sp.]